jgi:hypothetical protein
VSPLVGTYNLFLEQTDRLLVIPTTALTRNMDISLRSDGQTLFTGNDQLRANQLLEYHLDDSDAFHTAADSYGTVLLDANETASFVPFVLRERRAGTNGEIVDYVMPTVFGESPED